jgi:dienelactone hydrolase
MHRFGCATMAALAALATGPAHAADSAAAKAFGARAMVTQASLSPDGMSVALVQPLAESQANALFIGRLDGSGAPKPIFSSSGHPDRLEHCGWVSNTRLICTVYFDQMRDGYRLGFTRLVALNADGTKVQELTASSALRAEYSYNQNGGAIIDWLAGENDGAVLMTRSFAAQETTGTLATNQRTGLAVERVDTLTLARKIVEQPLSSAVDYISDQYGAVRVIGLQMSTAEGYSQSRVRTSFRPVGGGPLKPLGEFDFLARTGFAPEAVDRDLNAVYGFEPIDGRQAVTRITLDGSGKREVVLARPDVDVDSLIRIGRSHRVVGASFATERRQAEFFDPALRTLAGSLSKALPNQPAIQFVDASADETKLLLRAESDVGAGRYYLFDRTARKLSEIMPERPQLDGIKLAPVRAITYTAADGTKIPGYLTLPPGSDGKNLPAIVMPHGGPESRDEWGFDWLAQFFANRGYAVLQPNFRGSSGYGEAWFAKNGFQSWRIAVGDVNDAGRWLQSQGIAAPGKLAIVGWSYGGYAALQSGVLDPDLFKAIVAVAPVTDLDALREESRHFNNFRIIEAYIGKGAHIREGSPAQNAAMIKAPVLMFHGDEDSNVGVGESRLMLAKLKAAGGKAELVVFPALDHQLDDSASRTQMLQKSDDFLRASLGLPAGAP